MGILDLFGGKDIKDVDPKLGFFCAFIHYMKTDKTNDYIAAWGTTLLELVNEKEPNLDKNSCSNKVKQGQKGDQNKKKLKDVIELFQKISKGKSVTKKQIMDIYDASCAQPSRT